MARTVAIWGPTGLATPTLKLMLRSTPTTVAETITLTEHATVKRLYTGTVTASAGDYYHNLLSSGAYVGGGTITVGATDATTYYEDFAASPAGVNAEVVDAIATDTYAEPGQGAPAATTSLAAKINYLFKAWRNRSSQTATAYKLYADDATTVDQKSTVSDDNTTFESGEKVSGP